MLGLRRDEFRRTLGNVSLATVDETRVRLFFGFLRVFGPRRVGSGHGDVKPAASSTRNMEDAQRLRFMAFTSLGPGSSETRTDSNDGSTLHARGAGLP